MKYSNFVIKEKEKFLDFITSDNIILRKVISKYVEEKYKLKSLKREWKPGGGSTLFQITTPTKKIFLKAMSLKILIESKLEKEKSFIKIPAIRNEYTFIKDIENKVKKGSIPRIIFYEEKDDFGFLATEWLQPFKEIIKNLNIEETIQVYKKIYNFVELLFKNNIIHTDIHENNIRFRNKTPVIIDYGETRYFKQEVSFKKSLDYIGINKYGNVGKIPISDNGQINGYTSLARLKLVFDNYVKEKLLKYSKECSFGEDCSFNKDILQQPDDRIYQSIRIKGLNIEGQRPKDDGREKLVKFLCRYYSEKFDGLTYIDIGSNIGVFCFKIAKLLKIERVFGIEAFKKYIKFAEAIKFSLNSKKFEKISFCNLICGKDNIYKKICELDDKIISRKTLITILSTYHHIENKESFLSNLKKIKPEVLVIEFAIQDRYYVERENWKSEAFFIKNVLNFKFIEFIGISGDYKRPIVIYSREKMGNLLAIRLRLKIRINFGKMFLKKCIKKIYNILHDNMRRFLRTNTNKIIGIEVKNSCDKAIQWLKDNQVENKGIIISPKQKITYPEVTGYFISTLYQWGEKELVKDLIKWLISQQNEDGSFSAPDGTPYTFDTGQVISGFVAALDDFPEAEKPLRKACDWVLTQIRSDGKLITSSTEMWGDIADDRIHLYVLPPLIKAGKKINEPKYVNAAHRVLEYYKQRKDLLDFNTLSHFYAYIIEALYDLGEENLTRTAMKQISSLQKRDGSIPAYKNVSWVCTPGLAQLAVVWYKLGMKSNADRAIHWLEEIQNNTGGFYGSYGKGANYFSKEEISWAIKFFLDAYHWKIKTTFDQKIDIFPDTIDENDGRTQELLSFFGDLSGKKVIDVGCGKGRFLRILISKFPNANLYGWDISDSMLRFCPKEVITDCGGILDIKYPDNSFDSVYCIEVLEHAINIENAIREMIRILKPGGKIIIMDKNVSESGKLTVEPWEQWFTPEQILNLLNKYGVKTHYKSIAYGKHSKPDGLFIAWEGKKT